MKELLIVSLALILSVPSFAGAFVEGSGTDLKPETWRSAPVRLPEKIIERQIVMKEAKEIVPEYGITLGFVNDYLLIGYCTKYLFIEAGAKIVDGDKSAMVLAGGIMQGFPCITLPKYAYPRIGLALNPGLADKPLVGLFCGLERWLDERISIGADIYCWFGNAHYACPTVAAKGRIVI